MTAPRRSMTEKAPVTEATFQAQVVELAHICGWQVMHVRRSIGRRNGTRAYQTTTSIKGWPDLYMWHPDHGVIVRELKTDEKTSKVTPEQADVLRSLCAAGVDAAVWRPADFEEEIPSTLRGEPTPFAVARGAS